MRLRRWHDRLTTRVCLGCSVFLLCLIVASMFISEEWQSSDRYFAIRPGEVAMEWGSIYVTGLPPDTDVGCIPRLWIPGVLRYGDICIGPGTAVGKFFALSVWVPFVIISLAAAALIAYDSRSPSRGRCRCGYDLTGNTSGVCPECGKVLG